MRWAVAFKGFPPQGVSGRGYVTTRAVFSV